MFLQTLDLLSPNITLYYHKKIQHYTIASGIICLISYSAILGFSVYFFAEYFQKKNPTSYFYNKFTDDAGHFPFNSSGIFHYLNIDVPSDKIDLKSLNIIGLSDYMKWKIAINDLKNFEHWIYGVCEPEYAKGVESVLGSDLEEFLIGACVSKMWSVKDQKYYEYNDPQFHYPSIDYGMNNPNFTVYGIIVERCRERGLPGETKCNSKEEIEDYITRHSPVKLRMVDNYIDVSNYTHPSTKILYRVSNMIFKNYSVVNNLNFHPVKVRTHEGIIFEEIREQEHYYFDHNEKVTEDNSSTGALVCFFFFLQNRAQIYERSYKRLQEVLANIGGILKVIITIAFIVNRFFHDFKLLNDINHLIFGFSKETEVHSPNFHLVKIKSKSTFPSKIMIKEKNINEIFKAKTISSKKKVPFGKYIEFIFCNKRMLRDNPVPGLFLLRKKYLSEEFLFKSYMISENYHIQNEKTDHHTGINDLPKHKSSFMNGTNSLSCVELVTQKKDLLQKNKT